MEKLSTVTYGVISLVVVVILIFTIAVPVIEDSQKEIKTTEQNTGEFYSYSVGDSIPDMVITYNMTGDATASYSIDGTEIYKVNDYKCSIWTDHGYLRSNGNSGIYAIFDTLENTLVITGLTTVTIEDSTLTITHNDTDYEVGEISFIYYPTLDGDFGLFESPIHINKDAKGLAVASGTATNSGNYDPTIIASYENGEFTTIYSESYNPTTTPHSFDTIAVVESATVIDSTDPLNVELSRPKATYTINLTEKTVDMRWIVPIEYEHISQNDSMLITLLGVIPLMLAIIPVMLAVQLMTGSRRD